MSITSEYDENPDEFRAELKIPKDRVAVLIGTEGKVKRKLAKLTDTRIEVDSKEGDVFIFGEDGLKIFEAKEVIRAIARGFNPEVAFKLLNTEYVFDMLRFTDYANTKNTEIRLKGRVIGTDGKTRSIIEHLSEANVSVYGKTISIIGKLESASIAKRAVMMILQGAPHSTMYNWLEKKRKTLKRMEFEAKRIGEEFGERS